ncbi:MULTISPECIES: hypothetical protein [Streptomyces]|uniref:hypothetical protein n=1 Tax=Streptomyces TaxID=1883 RepID=UPI0007C6A9F0|nr:MULTISPECIES: hypothetical protein [Streptomyces]MDX2919662.1 hypothetical protein [Streptomyces sp. NE06-03C]MDX3607422.1 hypothetical protein [Streptomyces sp. FL06-04B]MDX3737075.1 hypothetical protein [Streptomyces sp. ID01-15D]
MARGIRNTIGLILAVVGAAAAVWAPFRNWYEGRLGHDFRVWELFTGAGITDSGAGLFASMFLPLFVGALLTVLGVAFRSRLLVLIAGIITLGFAVLWMVRQAQAQGSLTVTGDGDGLGSGVGLALLGGLLMLIGSAVMSGRERRAVRNARHEREQRGRDALDREEDTERHRTGVEQSYGTAARDGAAGGETDRAGATEARPDTDAGPARGTSAQGDSQRRFGRPQEQTSPPRGRPVPARDAGGEPGRGETDRTQYEQSDRAKGSERPEDGPSGRRYPDRGDQS